MIKIQICKLDKPVYGIFKYNAQLLRSVDGGKNYFYTGYGKFFRTFSEAKKYKSNVEN